MKFDGFVMEDGVLHQWPESSWHLALFRIRQFRCGVIYPETHHICSTILKMSSRYTRGAEQVCHVGGMAYIWATLIPCIREIPHTLEHVVEGNVITWLGIEPASAFAHHLIQPCLGGYIGAG